jgi:Secretion system C-terminal sorting domain
MMKSLLTLLFSVSLVGSVLAQAVLLPDPNDVIDATTAQLVDLSYQPNAGNINTSDQQSNFTLVSTAPVGAVTLVNVNNPTPKSLVTATLSIPAGFNGSINLIVQYKIGNDITTIPITYTVAANTVLAVELVNFKAKLSNQKVTLNWLTSKEENINFFSVERSKNGQNFVEIARIRTGNAKKDYAFVDEQPYDGNSYYRLKVTENYGSKIQYSPVVTIAGQSKGLLKAYPSVAYNELIVELPEGNRETTLNIVDMTGKVIMTQKTSSLQLPIDVSNLIAGHYLIVAQNDLGRYVEKFMKQE